MTDSDRRTRSMLTEASASDLIYGIRKRCITGRLTVGNWFKKALWRMSLAGPVYININKYWQQAASAEPVAYQVIFTLIDADGEQKHLYGKEFDSIEEAVNYANGEKGGPVAGLTREALQSEIPTERAPGTHFIMKPGLGR